MKKLNLISGLSGVILGFVYLFLALPDCYTYGYLTVACTREYIFNLIQLVFFTLFAVFLYNQLKFKGGKK